MTNNAVIPPRDGYLHFLKELCEKNDIVLIFDEVKTGFRVAEGGGAQQLFGVKPHLMYFCQSLGQWLSYFCSGWIGRHNAKLCK